MSIVDEQSDLLQEKQNETGRENEDDDEGGGERLALTLKGVDDADVTDDHDDDHVFSNRSKSLVAKTRQEMKSFLFPLTG